MLLLAVWRVHAFLPLLFVSLIVSSTCWFPPWWMQMSFRGMHLFFRWIQVLCVSRPSWQGSLLLLSCILTMLLRVSLDLVSASCPLCVGRPVLVDVPGVNGLEMSWCIQSLLLISYIRYAQWFYSAIRKRIASGHLHTSSMPLLFHLFM